MKQYNYDYPDYYSMEGVEEKALDSMREKFSTTIKEIAVTTELEDAYKNFTVKCHNGIELDCEISFRESSDHWEVTVWEVN